MHESRAVCLKIFPGEHAPEPPKEGFAHAALAFAPSALNFCRTNQN